MTITLNKSQYRALNALRGLPEEAHMLIMCSSLTPTGGGILEGPEEAFDELVEFISGELAEGMVSASASKALLSLCAALDPDCVDWLGM